MSQTDIIRLLRELQASMTDEERVELWQKIQEGYCTECGREEIDGPCQCWNDE